MNWDNIQTKKFIAAIAEVMSEKRDYLMELDSVVGDGDLGLTMSDGFSAAAAAIRDSDERDCGKLFYAAGRAMAAAVPSTMGTLMGNGMVSAAKRVKGNELLDNIAVSEMLSGWLEGVGKLGKAKIGEKTFLDGFEPGVNEFARHSSEPLETAVKLAAEAAKKGAQATVGMLAVHGRAAIRGEESRALLDAGAVVAQLIFEALERSVL